MAFAFSRPGHPGRPRDLALATASIAPASTLKALTAAYVLDRLGPHHRFQTRVIRSGDMLILAGGGDPTLSTDDLARLATDLVAQSPRPPTRFAVWGGALPAIPRIATEQAEHLPYNPAISGLMLNFNRVHLQWRRVGVDYQLSIEARGSSQSPRAQTISAVPGNHSTLFSYHQDGGREFWSVSRPALGKDGSRWLPVRLPELYAADVFQTLCRARGLVLPSPEVTTHLPAGEILARLDSPPVETLIRDMLRYSTNLTAEALGLHASGAPDLASSAGRMTDWLAAGDPGRLIGTVLADHSGLSEASRISALAMTRMLSGPCRDLGIASLLQRNPLQIQSDAPIAAKTGTLNFVSALAGYVGDAAFAILCIDPVRRASAIGKENPAGVASWTRSARQLQAELLQAFAADAAVT
ncbi:MAG: D-alanyl-D-alanine carboxypeptidase [Paracoccus sp. (in: a-proteobacteria)]|nr:D-alanyl-D-alanine carboxypeptidase [Paracoccus sp. (in: a-proteobacteria)]